MTNPYDPNGNNEGQQWSGWERPGQQQPPQQPGWNQPPQQPQPAWQPPQQQPQYGGPPQYGQQQPPYGQPQYQQPQQPQYGQPQYGQPQYGQQNPYQQGPAPLMPPTKKSGGRTKLIAAVAAVIVVGGGVGTYAAVSASSGSGNGASSPQKAVQSMVTDLDNSDLLGLLNDLAPNERDAISTPFTDAVDKLKTNDVVSSSANLKKVNGVSVATSGLTFASDTITINNHVQIVQLTGGTIKINADALKLPFTSDVLKAIQDKATGPTSKDKTINISDYVKKIGHPVRIAAQEVDGSWYPSLLYTIADNVTTAAHLQPPTQAASIPAVGASSADDAVKGVIEDLVGGKIQEAIELTSPDELQVLHDYGPLIVQKAHYNPGSAVIKNITFTDSSISGGTRVSLKSIDLGTPDAGDFSVTVNGACYNVTANGKSQDLCPDDFIKSITGVDLGGSGFTPDQQTAIKDLLSNAGSLGVDTTETGGKWYVNPVRSYFDIENVLLSGLKNGDGKALLSLLAK